MEEGDCGPAEEASRPIAGGRVRPWVERPAAVLLRRGRGGRVALTRSWASPALRAVVVVGLLTSWVALPPEAWPDMGAWLASPAGKLLGVLVLVPTYLLLVGLVNGTTVEAEPGGLRVDRGPLPVGRALVVDAAEIAQLYTRTRPGAGGSYQLLLRRRDGSEELLVDRLATPEEALFFEQEVEGALGIRDRQVVGELGREWVPEDYQDR